MSAIRSRLDSKYIRNTRKGFSARCPAHEDRTASLAVSEGENGTVIHCFAGCQTDDVLGALGLTFSDLYPPRDRASLTPAERSQARAAVIEAGWAAALKTLAQDVLLLQAAAGMLAQGLPLPPSDLTALSAAAIRIDNAKEVLCGRR